MHSQAWFGGPLVEIFSSQGSRAESTIRKTGSVKKNFEKSVKGYVMDLEGGRDVKVQLPLNDKESLCILHQFIVLQLFVPAGKGFSVEMTILDQSKTRRRMNLSCNNKEVSATPLHVRLPLDMVRRSMWINLCIDAAGLFHESFGPVTRISEYWCLESLSISATCRLRRIFSVKESLIDTSMDSDDVGDAAPVGVADDLPKGVELPPAVESCTQVLNMSKIRMWLQYNSASRSNIDLGRREKSLSPRSRGGSSVGGADGKVLHNGMHIAFGRRFPLPPTATMAPSFISHTPAPGGLAPRTAPQSFKHQDFMQTTIDSQLPLPVSTPKSKTMNAVNPQTPHSAPVRVRKGKIPLYYPESERSTPVEGHEGTEPRENIRGLREARSKSLKNLTERRRELPARSLRYKQVDTLPPGFPSNPVSPSLTAKSPPHSYMGIGLPLLRKDRESTEESAKVGPDRGRKKFSLDAAEEEDEEERGTFSFLQNAHNRSSQSMEMPESPRSSFSMARKEHIKRKEALMLPANSMLQGGSAGSSSSDWTEKKFSASQDVQATDDVSSSMRLFESLAVQVPVTPGSAQVFDVNSIPAARNSSSQPARISSSEQAAEEIPEECLDSAKGWNSDSSEGSVYQTSPRSNRVYNSHKYEDQGGEQGGSEQQMYTHISYPHAVRSRRENVSDESTPEGNEEGARGKTSEERSEAEKSLFLHALGGAAGQDDRDFKEVRFADSLGRDSFRAPSDFDAESPSETPKDGQDFFGEDPREEKREPEEEEEGKREEREERKEKEEEALQWASSQHGYKMLSAVDRLTTPPIIPPSQQDLSSPFDVGYMHLTSSFRRREGEPYQDGREAAAQAQEEAYGISPQGEDDEEEEEDLELIYDPILNCYWDPQNNKYYELRNP
uniref:CFA20 domain-containing protein n=1 Tax=Guillardia theta TaxID=55529 RepID=A0A7S4HAF6_GUITH|mmetsp:Transcript_12065/g.41952  ORF Transcript_12065/g.41952 Transcript_12065/m.41952 type:complete len:895 (+) Transcript_12065:176-2860(+)